MKKLRKSSFVKNYLVLIKKNADCYEIAKILILKINFTVEEIFDCYNQVCNMLFKHMGYKLILIVV